MSDLRVRPLRAHAHAHGRLGAAHGVEGELRHVPRIHPCHGQRRTAHDDLSRRDQRRPGDRGAREEGAFVKAGEPHRHVQEYGPAAARDHDRGADHASSSRSSQTLRLQYDNTHLSNQRTMTETDVPDRPARARLEAQAAASLRRAARRKARSTTSRRSSRATGRISRRRKKRCGSKRSSGRRSSMRMNTAQDAMKQESRDRAREPREPRDRRADHGPAHAARGERRRIESVWATDRPGRRGRRVQGQRVHRRVLYLARHDRPNSRPSRSTARATSSRSARSIPEVTNRQFEVDLLFTGRPAGRYPPRPDGADAARDRPAGGHASARERRVLRRYGRAVGVRRGSLR